jgi:uncharacterized SAM-binding protein YcdF (DUF218 family)
LNWISLSRWLSWKQRRFLKLSILFVLSGLLSSCLLINTLKLEQASSHPVDAFFVLGGSIRREMYVTQLAKKYPHVPILISRGSLEPCVWLLFQRDHAPIDQVWLEKCANNTFKNFYFGLPILRQWGVHKVKLITSGTHVFRSMWMAKILLGSHGIWVEPEFVPEIGIPGNQESWLKTGFDIGRSLVWAILSQVIEPQCPHLQRLTNINLQYWQVSGFKCEHQAEIDSQSDMNFSK